MNDYIFLNGKLFQFMDRKCSKIKQGSSPNRSLNGTLNIDYTTIQTKKEWLFTFECDERELLRLYNIWTLNNTYTFIDWDGNSYIVTCTNLNFDENFIGEENGVCWFNLTLEFKEI